MASADSTPASSPQNNQLKALIALVVLSCVWGITWVLSKQALAYAPPFAFAAERCIGGAFALLVVLRITGRRLTLTAPKQTIAISLVQVSGFMIFQTCALVIGGPGKTSVLIFTMPIWTLILARMVLGEKLRGLQWVAAVSTLTGLLFIISPWNLQGNVLGDCLGVGAAMCWAGGTILVKRFRANHTVDLINLTTWQMLIGSLPLIILALVLPEHPTQWTSHYIVLLCVISLISTSLGWWLWIYILDSLPAWEASLSVLGTPVIAIVSSTLMLGEQFKMIEVMGMLLIGAGLSSLSLFGYLNSKRNAAKQAP
jgi:drug/metabolite transporter (DMT)-like permease